MTLPSLPRLRPFASRLAILCVAVAASVAFAAGVKPPQPAPDAAQAPEANVAASAGTQSQGPKETLTGEVITVSPRGFEPDEVTRPHGRFFLVIENRSGQRGLTFALDPEHGGRVREFTQPEDELDWADELNLPPGRYTLAVADRPGWVCRLNITPR